MTSRKLIVYMFDEKVGELIEKNGRTLSFKYTENAKYPISISMPIQKEAYGDLETRAFFEGLLPEGTVKDRLQKTEGVSNNVFSLLELVGGECAGAISLFKDEITKEENNIKDIEIDINELENIIKKSYIRPLLRSEGIRLSLAGAQSKIAIRIDEKNKKFFLPNKKNISTHIIKPPITWFDGIDDLLYNEFFCLKLYKKIFDEDTLNPEIIRFRSANCLLLSRYDRTYYPIRKDDNFKFQVGRLHQEDLCQTMRILPSNKYENEGGPSIKKIIKFLLETKCFGGEKFLNITIFNYLIGNSDAHGKNFSLIHFYNNEDQVLLAPAYDLVSTCIYYPKLDKKMAMKIGGEYDPDKIYRIHFQKMAEEIDVKPQYILKLLDNTRGIITQKAIELKEQLKSQNITSPVFDKIIKLIENRVKRLSE